MSDEGTVVYLDASAIVKLAVVEAESLAVRRFLRGHPTRVSCALVRVEVPRAVQVQGELAVARARRALTSIELIPLDDALLDAAARVRPPLLRSLDAIHLAAALSLGSALGVVVTYDRRMREAALVLGLPVEAPA